MGDLEDWSESNADLIQERQSVQFLSCSNLSPDSICTQRLSIAEQSTRAIIWNVQPTVVSEERRRAVIDYVQRLLRGYVGCEVFPFGSVPLKTYLPDGDIDLTAFGGSNVEDALAREVSSVLEGEDQNRDAEFIVKDVQIINAEVKLVKCLVQNVVVDISFNQLGGLCTLCFLEQVDRLIGKDHLFKRSIILIKTWCYYESRILGAHHGLISTYALETLVLYIFHLFHSSLNGPLAVLYRFLDYFSKFDWDNCCISVNGPVRISSLPEIVAERPDNGGLDLLLSNEFLKGCVDMFSVPSRGHDMHSRTFLQKHLNIIDPLKENNNLGRSISKGNSYRIRSAFTYGARKLGRILSQPGESISFELRIFFMNTLNMHSGGCRPDIQDPLPKDDFNGYANVMPIENSEDNTTAFLLKSFTLSCVSGENKFDPEEQLQNGVSEISGMKIKVGNTSQTYNLENGGLVSESRHYGDAKDLATPRVTGLIASDVTPKYSPPTIIDASVPLLAKAHHAPHHYISHSTVEYERIRNGNSNEKHVEIADDATIKSPNSVSHPENLKSISDLNGEYDVHFHSLQYGRWFYDYFSTAPISGMPSQYSSQFQANNSWSSIRRSAQYRRDTYSHANVNVIVPRPTFFPMNPHVIPNSTFCMDEIPKSRGTGTYFPNMNNQSNRFMRFSSARGRNHVPVRSPRNNGWATALVEPNSQDGTNHDVLLPQVSGNFGSPEINRIGSPRIDFSSPNRVLLSPEKAVEFGSFGQLQLGGSVVTSKSPRTIKIPTDERVMQTYRLKDEEEFPPLST